MGVLKIMYTILLGNTSRKNFEDIRGDEWIILWRICSMEEQLSHRHSRFLLIHASNNGTTGLRNRFLMNSSVNTLPRTECGHKTIQQLCILCVRVA
jgi:hypothetical protein